MAVHEILLKNPTLPNVIREGNALMISQLMAAGRKEGMQNLDDQLMLDTDLGEHARRPGRVEPRDAHEPPKLPQQSVQDRQARSIDDLQVKLLVEIEKGAIMIRDFEALTQLG